MTIDWKNMGDAEKNFWGWNSFKMDKVSIILFNKILTLPGTFILFQFNRHTFINFHKYQLVALQVIWNKF